MKEGDARNWTPEKRQTVRRSYGDESTFSPQRTEPTVAVRAMMPSVGEPAVSQDHGEANESSYCVAIHTSCTFTSMNLMMGRRIMYNGIQPSSGFLQPFCCPYVQSIRPHPSEQLRWEPGTGNCHPQQVRYAWRRNHSPHPSARFSWQRRQPFPVSVQSCILCTTPPSSNPSGRVFNPAIALTLTPPKHHRNPIIKGRCRCSR